MNGKTRVAGDKSISHRAVMLGSIAEGVTRISGFLEAADSMATLSAFKSMGVRVDGPQDGQVAIEGVGLWGLKESKEALDLGNSGTSMRLMSGLLAGQAFDSKLVGDGSLSERPMRRVAEPLSLMGADIHTSERGTAPLRIKGGHPLTGIDYQMPIASAQVKSCLLLAGLYAKGKTCVTEPAPMRDHTERMLTGFGYPTERQGAKVCVSGGGSLKATEIDVPGDISSAAFFIVAGAIKPGAKIELSHVGMNPTRSGVLDILRLMGARIEVRNKRNVGGEPVADLMVSSSPLHGVEIPEKLVPLAIDEFPIIFIAAACAEGETRVSGAAELRMKESDRIQVMADGLGELGIMAISKEDGIVIRGSRISGGTVESHGDHRVAMAFAIAGLRATADIRIKDCENVNTSFPNFFEIARELGLRIDRKEAK